MPEEIRKIFFNKEEVGEAIMAFARAEPIDLPPSRIEEVRIGASETAAVVLCFVSAKPDEPYMVPFTLDQAGKALMLFCREKKIPLPRAAQKKVEPQKGGLLLTSRFSDI